MLTPKMQIVGDAHSGVAGEPGDDVSISLSEMMDSLSMALDLINPALDAHHKSVCYGACCLAERLGLPVDDYNDLFAASILHDIGAIALAHLQSMTESEGKLLQVAGYPHDIGKLLVPDSILEKNGQLDLEEWRIVRAHSYHTFQVLESVEGLKEIAMWAADHPEHLDGDGYPFRRESEELPMGSRILAVADVFTALAEDRPYRPGMEKDRIVKTLDEMAGERKLDPAIVACLVDHFDQVQEVREREQRQTQSALADFWETAGAQSTA